VLLANQKPRAHRERASPPFFDLASEPNNRRIALKYKPASPFGYHESANHPKNSSIAFPVSLGRQFDQNPRGKH